MPGEHTILFDFKCDGGGLGKGGRGALQVDGRTATTGRIDRTLAFRLSLDETLDRGEDTGTPVSEDYRVPFKFTGQLEKVTVYLKPVPLTAADQKNSKKPQPPSPPPPRSK
jgi:arylsulfatase